MNVYITVQGNLVEYNTLQYHWAQYGFLVELRTVGDKMMYLQYFHRMPCEMLNTKGGHLVCTYFYKVPTSFVFVFDSFIGSIRNNKHFEMIIYWYTQKSIICVGD